MRNLADPGLPSVFLPLRYMVEVRNAPQDKLSLPLYTEKVSIEFLCGWDLIESVSVHIQAALHRAVLANFCQASILNHVNGPAITEEVQNAARLNLNRALNNLVVPIQEQCYLAATQKMPECPGASHYSPIDLHSLTSSVLQLTTSPSEWTPIHIYPIILQVSILFSFCSFPPSMLWDVPECITLGTVASD